MANWCNNSLQVTGEKEEVKRFYETGLKLDEYKTETWSIEQYHPYQGEWDYKWCIDNWGTKWVDDPQWEIEDNCFSVDFISANGSPVEWLMKVQGDYKDLNFKLSYLEPGCNFCGIAYTISDSKGNTLINDICEDICEYVNEDGDQIYYDKEKEKWIVNSTGEEMGEGEYTNAINHLEKFYKANARERRINEIFED